MRTETQELTLQTALSDPLIGAVMAADNVDRGKLEVTLLRIAAGLRPSVPASIPAGCVCSHSAWQICDATTQRGVRSQRNHQAVDLPRIVTRGAERRGIQRGHDNLMMRWPVGEPQEDRVPEITFDNDPQAMSLTTPGNYEMV